LIPLASEKTVVPNQGSAALTQARRGAMPENSRVLLVDDDSLSRLLTRDALEERGMQVIEAASGAEALTQFSSVIVDIVLLDAIMPGMDGFDVCRGIRQTTSGQHIPILMLTGLDDEQSVSKAYEAGASDFFVKSTQWTLLVHRCRYLLRASRMRDDLVRSELRVEKAQRIARLGVWEWDSNSDRIFPSSQCCKLLEVEAEANGVEPTRVWRAVHPEDRSRVDAFFERMLAGQVSGHLDCRILKSTGGIRIVHIDAELERDRSGKISKLHGITQDITERCEAESKIRHLANYDSLTGLPNRRYFREQLSEAIGRSRLDGSHVAVLFLDLDNFKRINDTLGHYAGDNLLRECASRLAACLRPTDRLSRDPGAASADLGSVARLGGDEFTVLLTDLQSDEHADMVAQRILDSLQVPFVLGSHECYVTGSIGVSIFPRDGDDVDTILRTADMAMYAVKDTGRNGHCAYTPKLDSATHKRLDVSNALHKAIEREELRLHYQPQIDTMTGKVIAAEALMRWQRGDRLVPPDEFIPIASETGLILPLGDWAIQQACQQIALWRDSGRQQMPIAVNISANAFQSAGFVQKVESCIRAAGIEPEFIELEITETLLMQDLKAALPALEALSDFGVKLSVDDFGTGYSSLSYLRRLPIDTLKIDRSFVRELSEGSDDEAIVAAIGALTRALNLRVIAEGVETAEQAGLLKVHGCFLMQGYLFSRPLPIEAFDNYIASMTPVESSPAPRKVIALRPRQSAE
jgi:diguanylate cyclase (GGDEF)-like protein